MYPKRLAALVAGLVLYTASPALAGTAYTVDRLDDDAFAADCLGAVPNDCSLRGAIRAANQDGVASQIILPHGQYDLTLEGDEEFAVAGDLDIRDDSLTLQAAAGAHPVIRQLASDRIFHVHSSAGDIELLGPMTWLGGTALQGPSAHGGSIFFFRGDSLVLTDIHMIGGFASALGGCLAWSGSHTTTGSLDMTSVSFSDCEAEAKGGGFHIETADATVSLGDVEVTDNTAGQAGGGGVVFGSATPLFIERSSFERNTAANPQGSAFGGGLDIGSGTVIVHESTFSHNTAGSPASTSGNGGGIYVQNAELFLWNSTLSENRIEAPTARGTELAASSSTVDLNFVTAKALLPATSPSIEIGSNSSSTIFASILEAECNALGTVVSEGVNVEYPPGGALTTQCNLTHVSDVLRSAPVLKPLAGYGGPTSTHALIPAEQGWAFLVPSSSCPPTDQRGAQRLGLFCYSGAHEAGAQAPGSQIFADGFESATAAAWSAAAP